MKLQPAESGRGPGRCWFYMWAEREVGLAAQKRLRGLYGKPTIWCWRRLLRVPWTAKRSNQTILEEINPEYSLEGRRLKLKLQYFGYLMQRANSLKKTLMLGKTEDKWRRG